MNRPTSRQGFRLVCAMAMVVVVGCSSQPELDPTHQSLIAFRLVLDDCSPPALRLSFEGEILCLQDPATIADGEIRTLAAGSQTQTLILDMQLTEVGEQRLRDVTRANQGRFLALVIDGSVRTVSEIAGEVGSPGQAAVPVSHLEGERIAQLVRAKWPPTSGS